MKNKLMIGALLCTSLLMVTGCGGNKTEEKTTASKSEVKKQEKMTFTVYNVAGMGEFNEAILLPKFQEAYGDKYNINYETLSANDVVAKIEAQGLQKGKGNINVVISGDNGVTVGNQAGVWLSLEDKLSDVNYENLLELTKTAMTNSDYVAVPALMNNADPAISYVPNTDVGKALEAVIGGDGEISYSELKEFLIDSPTKPKFGRGLITTSGAGDFWTWGLLMDQGEYGLNAEPTKSVEWAADLYERADVRLYTGTGTTFTELTEGGVDIIAQQVPWWARLHAKGKVDNLPDAIKEDTKGLEISKTVLMTGENVKPLASGHYYMIPANLSPEMVEASMEFIKFAIKPEINSGVYAATSMPAYKTSTLDNVKDDNIKMVWDMVSKVMPARNVGETGEQVLPSNTILTETNPAILAKYYKAWREKVEVKASN